jgi:hypothetical protein
MSDDVISFECHVSCTYSVDHIFFVNDCTPRYAESSVYYPFFDLELYTDESIMYIITQPLFLYLPSITLRYSTIEFSNITKKLALFPNDSTLISSRLSFPFTPPRLCDTHPPPLPHHKELSLSQPISHHSPSLP